MRVYRSKRVRQEWTDEDRSRAAHMWSNGSSNDEIAASLGRKPAAVRAWLHHHCRLWHEPEPVSYPQETIGHDEIPAWYELGWRYVGLGDGGYIFEWQSPGTVRIPKFYNPRPNNLELVA